MRELGKAVLAAAAICGAVWALLLIGLGNVGLQRSVTVGPQVLLTEHLLVTIGSLLISVGVALRRRLRAAWWIFVIWWIILPQLVRIFSIIGGGPLLQVAGLVIMSVVLVILWRARPQFQARGARGNLLAAMICFLVGGVVILILGTWLVSTFGTSPDASTAALHVVDKLLGEVGQRWHLQIWR